MSRIVSLRPPMLTLIVSPSTTSARVARTVPAGQPGPAGVALAGTGEGVGGALIAVAAAAGVAVGRGGAVVAVRAATTVVGGAVVGGALVGALVRVGESMGRAGTAVGGMARAALTVAVGLVVAFWLVGVRRKMAEQPMQSSHRAARPPQPTASFPRRPPRHSAPMRSVKARKRCIVIPPGYGMDAPVHLI